LLIAKNVTEQADLHIHFTDSHVVSVMELRLFGPKTKK